MDRFAFGNNNQFEELKRTLQDDRCHIYKECSLPSGFNRPLCRIGFEKYQFDKTSYKLLIDYGITYSGGRRVSPLLKILLESGELVFLDFNDLKVFMQSLRNLI